MTKRYSILQKKLQELESLLNDIFSFSEDHDRNTIPPHYFTAKLTNLTTEFIQRLDFFKSLLTAEKTSHPSKPHHLQHMSQRLDELESAFLDWAGFGNSSPQHHIDDASTCSCTESCLNDDGEVSDDKAPESLAVYGDPEIVVDDGLEVSEQEEDDDDGLAMVEYKECFGGEKEAASFGDVGYFSDCLAEEGKEEYDNYNGAANYYNRNSERVRVDFVEKGKGWFLGALASGMVLGMSFMGLVTTIFSGCFESGDQQFDNFLTPT